MICQWLTLTSRNGAACLSVPEEQRSRHRGLPSDYTAITLHCMNDPLSLLHLKLTETHQKKLESREKGVRERTILQ